MAPVLALVQAPTAVLGAAIFYSLFAIVVLSVMIEGYDYTTGRLTSGLTKVVRHVPGFGRVAAETIDRFDNELREWMSRLLRIHQDLAAQCFDALRWIVRETVDTMVAAVEAIDSAIEGVITETIPTQTKARTDPLYKQSAGLRAQDRIEAQRRAGADAALQRRIETVAEPVTVIRRVQVPQRVATAIPWLERAVQGLRADVTVLGNAVVRPLRARVSRVETLFPAALTGAAGLALLSRAGFRWNCTNVQRASKLLCRMPVGLLEALLAGTLVLAIVLRPRGLAVAAQRVAEALASRIREIVELYPAEQLAAPVIQSTRLDVASTRGP